MSSVRADGAELHYTVRGHGPMCLVPCSIGTGHFELLTAGLARSFHDRLRGPAREPAVRPALAADLTFDVLARDLEAVRAAVGAERWWVLGYSIMGSLAIEYARRCPDTRLARRWWRARHRSGDMARMVQEGTAYVAAAASAERKQIFADNIAALPPGTDPRMAVPAQTPLRFFDPRFNVMPLLMVAEFKPDFFAHLMGALTSSWDVLAGPPLLAPLLVAHGRHDYVVPHTMWDDVLPRLPTASFALFERSGHQPFFEEPERFADVVSAWMSQPAVRHSK